MRLPNYFHAFIRNINGRFDLFRIKLGKNTNVNVIFGYSKIYEFNNRLKKFENPGIRISIFLFYFLSRNVKVKIRFD